MALNHMTGGAGRNPDTTVTIARILEKPVRISRVIAGMGRALLLEEGILCLFMLTVL